MHEIATVIDIRTSPKSRFGQFNKRALAERLNAEGISYLHAPLLGGRNPLPVNEVARELENYLPTPVRTCLLCSEGDPLECHRHTLVAPVVREMGYSVLQILRDGNLWEDR